MKKAKKELKVRFLGNADGYTDLFLKVLQKNYAIKKTYKNFDLLVYDYLDKKAFSIFCQYQGKKVLISGENCEYIIDYQRSLLILFISLFIKKVMNKLPFFKGNPVNFPTTKPNTSTRVSQKDKSSKSFKGLFFSSYSWFKKLINPKNLVRVSDYFYIYHTAKLLSLKKNINLLIEKANPDFLKNKRRNILTYFRSNQQRKNEYAILTNNCKNDNVLNFPLFFAYNHNKKKDFIIIKKKRLYEKKKHFCAFIVSNERSKGRIRFFHELNKYKEVHSYGRVLNNRTPPKKFISRKNDFLNYELYRDYKFVICFENSIANDYITEKLSNAMLGNSIGIYQGAPNIGEFFNTKSFINFHDYGSYDKMIEKVIELDQDDEKYYKMLREPFFVGNKLPPRFKNLEKDLSTFIDKALD